jgi:hypothetical protein
LRFTEQPLPLAEYDVGQYTLHLALNDTPFEVTLYVEDTTLPTAEPAHKVILIGEEISPEDFVTDPYDASGIKSITFVDEMDTRPQRDMAVVEIAIEDNHGNIAIINGALTVRVNQDPPTIEGLDTIEVQLGHPIIFLHQGLTILDDFGRDMIEYDRVQVDISGVDQNEVGEYTAIYTVVDFSGLITEETVIVRVINVDPEEVKERVDALLWGSGSQSGIINDRMSQREIVNTIFWWVRRNISYTPTRGVGFSAFEGADIALRTRRGNCYIFYSISEVMLTQAGIENMRIQRIAGTPTTHLWNLVNPDGAGWYHFDSLPLTSELGVNSLMYMFTNTQAERFAQLMAPRHGAPTYYTFNADDYPEIMP